MVSNPNFYGQSTTGTPNQIQDGADFPHTGLLKALSLGMKQNFVINGFDITPSSATTGTVSTGTIFRDGKMISINSGSPPYSISLDTTYTNGYHLLVVDSTNTVVVRNPASPDIGADRVPDYDDGDVIIAVLTYTGNNPFTIQFLTINKVENTLSVGYDSGGTYTEAGSLTGDSNGITMTGLYKLDTLPTATVATDDKVIVQDTNDADKIKTITAQSIADLKDITGKQDTLSGLSLTSVTPLSADKILIQDNSDSDNL